MTSIYLYQMIAITDFSGINAFKEKIAWGLVGIILTTLAVNMLLFMYEACKLNYRKAKRCLLLRAHNKAKAKIYVDVNDS